jgi:glycosyltransferase involved in cell wall biosynthesis
MRMFYIANARLPSERAHTVHIMKMCQAFVKLGLDVELVVPFRVQTKTMRKVKDIWDYYGITERFKITRLPSIDMMWLDLYTKKLQKLRHRIQASSFTFSAILYSLLKGSDIYYTREFAVASILNYWCKVFYEDHEFYAKGRIKWLKNIVGLIVITEGLKEDYVKEGFPVEKILVAQDGADIKMFDHPYPKDKVRKELGIPLSKKIVGYIGHLYEYNGVYTLAESMKNLHGYIAYFIGGMDEDLKKFRKFINDRRIQNVVNIGHIPPSQVPKYMAAFDVLVLPITKRRLPKYVSPLKLFEYMASKRPIVASDLPAIREILKDGENAIFVEPEDPDVLTEGIKKLEDEGFAKKIVENAYIDVQKYTWDERAKKVLEFIEHRVKHG